MYGRSALHLLCTCYARDPEVAGVVHVAVFHGAIQGSLLSLLLSYSPLWGRFAAGLPLYGKVVMLLYHLESCAGWRQFSIGTYPMVSEFSSSLGCTWMVGRRCGMYWIGFSDVAWCMELVQVSMVMFPSK